MKKLSLAMYLIFILCSHMTAQYKYDYTWPFGYDFDDTFSGAETSLLEFSIGKPTVRLVNGNLDLSNAIAAISDPQSGRLMFFTNGCSITDSTFQTMKNGDDINRGTYHNNFCNGTYGFYPLQQGMTVVPDPFYNQGYYLIHRTKYTVGYTCGDIRYSYIDMSLNNGKGEVTKKNIPIIESLDLPCGYMTAIKHADGLGWWVTIGHSDEGKYYTILLDKNGFNLQHIQTIGLPILHPGQAVFSPDGTKYLSYDDGQGLHCFDFDRSTGMLSNYQIARTEIDSSIGGLAISPNSRFAYVILSKKIIQVDLYEENLIDGAEVVAVPDTTMGTFFEQNFGFGGLGPDCKIYVVPGSGSYTIHAIYNPNEKGIACDVRQQDIKLPSPRSNWSIPNFPHYRIDEDDICDPTITSIFPQEYIDIPLTIYPNPFEDSFTIKMKGNVSLVTIYNTEGNLVYTSSSYSGDNTNIALDVPSGLYIVKLLLSNGNSFTRKVMKL